MDEKEQKNLLKELDVIIKSNNCSYIVQFYGAAFTEVCCFTFSAHRNHFRFLLKGDCLICMELMDISLERLYKTVYEKLRERLPEDIIGKVAVDVKELKFLTSVCSYRTKKFFYFLRL